MTYSLCITGTHNYDIRSLEFLRYIPYPKIIYTKNPILPGYSGLIDVDIDYGAEHPGYLKYIIDNYSNLPDITLFCHCHETSWHQNKPLGTIIKNIENELNNIEYYNITDNIPGYNFVVFENEDEKSYGFSGDNDEHKETIKKYMSKLNIQTPEKYYDRIQTTHILGKKRIKMWEELFPDLNLPPYLLTKYSPQPFISKKLILQHPKEYYIKLYTILRDIRHNYPNDHISENSRHLFAFMYEFILPYLMTGYNNEIDYYIDKNLEKFI